MVASGHQDRAVVERSMPGTEQVRFVVVDLLDALGVEPRVRVVGEALWLEVPEPSLDAVGGLVVPRSKQHLPCVQVNHMRAHVG